MLFADLSLVDEFQTELDEIKVNQAKLHARQLVILNQLERAGVSSRSGARTMAEWTATRLDIPAGTAKELVAAANRLGRDPWLFDELAAGRLSLERAMATVRLEATEAPMSVVDKSFELELAAVSRLTHKYRRMNRHDERRVFADRHFVIQPSLDESRWRMWGELPGKDGRIVDQALSERADEMRQLPGGGHFTQGQRQADALVGMAQDSLSRSHGGVDSAGGPEGVVFVDLDLANGSGGELGAEVEYGPRVGPNTLEELLCSGSVQLVGLQDGKPAIASGNTRTIPPAVRRFVAWRDGGCSVAGCHSRYRLQPHHIRHRANGGDHDPENLATLCWFHHHVAVHGAGFRLTDEGPPSCRQLIAPQRYRGPPEG
ncbi:MAG: DUF222 domain-containing protein [Acidimicrobiia bacterium]|nr:DUF222 domain-containing protein [Acidimicrobiia bacterium]